MSLIHGRNGTGQRNSFRRTGAVHRHEAAVCRAGAGGENGDFNEAREIQQRILAAYEQDFSKHAPHEVVPRIRMLWNSIPAQLTKENKKFIYGLIKDGARAREVEPAIIAMKNLTSSPYREVNKFQFRPVDCEARRVRWAAPKRKRLSLSNSFCRVILRQPLYSTTFFSVFRTYFFD